MAASSSGRLRLDPRARLRDAADALFALGGVRVSHGVRRVGGGAVHHAEAGAGPPLVLLHGAGGGGANWFRCMAGLAAEFRAIAPDLPGFGESDPLAPEAPLGRQAAGLVGAWLEDLAPPPWILVGTSFGALAALRLAQQRPGDVAAVVAIDAVGLGRQVPWPVRLAADRRLGRLLLSPSRTGTRLLFDTLLVSDRHALPPAHRAALLDYLWLSDAAGGARTLRASLRHFAGPRGQREILADAELADLALPALLVWGERDRFVPLRDGRQAARRMPDAALEVVPGAGHSPNWERPQAVLDAIGRFLRDVSARRA